MTGNEPRQGARQLVLDLGQAPSYDADEFLVSSSNADAHAMIGRWPSWPRRTALLIGPSGAGKSHLGSIWAGATGALVVMPGDRLDPGLSAERAILLVEDIDRAAHSEPALFHLINLVEETRGWMLMTARSAPSAWGIRTPDLLSRLRLASLTSISEPDLPLLRAVIVKLFADRQIRIEEDVVAHAALHCDRSLEAISRFVAAVDDDALAAGRRITRPMAAQTIARLKQTFALNE